MQYQYVHRLTGDQRSFFRGISTHLQLPVYIYGSITRWDYIPGKSDIDVDIFSKDEHASAYQLSKYLQIPSDEVKKTVYKIGHKIIRGYKMKYTRGSINAEISIYPIQNKQVIIDDHQTYISIWIIGMILILKTLYYWTGIIPSSQYKYWKRVLMNRNSELKFIVLD